MEQSFIVALVFLSSVAFVGQLCALPAEASPTTTTTTGSSSDRTMATSTEYRSAMPTTTPPTMAKDAKEPEDIKAAATASKDVKDAIKAAKEAKKNKKECMKDCGTEYDPICAHDPADTTSKPRSFGSQCALEVHNCEMGTKLVMKSKGECPGSGGVKMYAGFQLG